MMTPLNHQLRSPRWTLQLFILASILATTAAFSPTHRGHGRLFLDTADTAEWSQLLPTGIFHGVTTNPVLLERAGQPCTIENLHRMAETAFLQVDEFMCQTWGATVDELVDTGMALSAPARDRIVVKVPVTLIGVQAASKLIQSGCRVCLTACYSRKQAMLAAGVGAEYLAPYLGRMTDAGKKGDEECLEMMDIVAGLKSDTRILVASLRDAATMAELASSGMDTFTFAPEVARELFLDPLTDQAAADFEEAASRGANS